MRINILKGMAVLLLNIIATFHLFSQAPKTWDVGSIHQAIEELNFLGTALYVAAHPDDENTGMISYLANEVNARTTYLSLTRGDGGQNLVGPEIRELLGVIRTEELLAARRIDGGNQFFTRANDFGYSKHPDETLAIWDKDEVLADVVWAIRKWRPDIVINRFDHDSAGETHGHHTSSAILSYEAFDLAGDPSIYPSQLEFVEPWKPRRLFFNTSWWFYGSQEAFDKADKSDLISVDIGAYYPGMGSSNTEVSARSRSMHKSQGFGATLQRGSNEEFIKLLKGDMPSGNDPFQGINTTWSRVEGGAPIGDILKKVEAEFNFNDPSVSVPDLLRAKKMIEKLPDGFWKEVKSAAIKDVIQACMGLYLEANADNYSLSPGDSIELDLEMVNRSDVDVSVSSIEYLKLGFDTLLQAELPNNKDHKFSKKLKLPSDLEYSSPYWLRKPASLGMYTVDDQTMRGLPETPPSLHVRFHLLVDGQPISFDKPVVYKRTDRVRGEVYRPLVISPPVFVKVPDKIQVFANGAARQVGVEVMAGRADISGTVTLDHPDGWTLEPASQQFSLHQKGAIAALTFTLYPPDYQDEGDLLAKVSLDGKSYHQEQVLIDYEHIPVQTIFSESKARVVKIGLEKEGEKVGYIMGAGDAIPASLEQIGYEVTLLDQSDVNASELKGYDAVIMGIRAYNTEGWLRFKQKDLLEYVKQGGNLIIQYNTNRGLVIPEEEMAPYKLELSRDRVTVEEAEVTILEPNHPILNFPNKITQDDFKGWVQERGLYFPNAWDETHFTALLSSHDPGEDPLNGSLLIAPYGEGNYIYTGLSFFRELPAGVPGAFRLLANLISAGKHEGP